MKISQKVLGVLTYTVYFVFDSESLNSPISVVCTILADTHGRSDLVRCRYY